MLECIDLKFQGRDIASFGRRYGYPKAKDDINWLFLNVSPVTMSNAQTYGPFFRDLIESFNFPAHRIVIEVVEHPFDDNDFLTETVSFYKNLGCLIAIDDFGAGHSNFDRIWTLPPHIVKLDRSFLIKASMEKSIRSLLPGIVSLLHQAGSLVLIKGIETRTGFRLGIPLSPRPYLSITGAHMCITLSMKFSNRDQETVLCCDLLA